MAYENLCEEIASRLDDACYNYLIDNGFSEVKESQYDITAKEMLDNYFYIRVDADEEVAVDGARLFAEVRAELDYDEMIALCGYLDPVVQEYAYDAYFDMEDAGIASAVIDL